MTVLSVVVAAAADASPGGIGLGFVLITAGVVGLVLSLPSIWRGRMIVEPDGRSVATMADLSEEEFVDDGLDACVRFGLTLLCLALAAIPIVGGISATVGGFGSLGEASREPGTVWWATGHKDGRMLFAGLVIFVISALATFSFWPNRRDVAPDRSAIRAMRRLFATVAAVGGLAGVPLILSEYTFEAVSVTVAVVQPSTLKGHYDEPEILTDGGERLFFPSRDHDRFTSFPAEYLCIRHHVPVFGGVVGDCVFMDDIPQPAQAGDGS